MANLQTAASPSRLSWHRAWEWVRSWPVVITTEPWVKPISIALGTRFAIYILIFVFAGLFPVAPDSKPGFWKALSEWDGEWYFKIAQNGYTWQGPNALSEIAFWPLYPLLARVTSFLVGDLRWAFLLVTTVSSILFLYYLYRLAQLDFSQAVADRAIVYAAVFPGAFILAGFYSEATAFALTVAAFYYARLGRWRLAIALGFLTTLTRLPALAILIPLAYEYWRQRGLRWQALSLAIIPLGTLSFALYIWYLSGNPWTIVTVEHTAWFRSTVAPWELVRMALDRALWPWNHPEVSVNVLDGGTILLFIGLTIWSIWKMPRAYWLYSVPVLLASLSQMVDPAKAQPTASITRYLMAIFPGYIALGQIARNPIVDQAVRWTFAMLMAVFAIYFFSRFWVL